MLLVLGLLPGSLPAEQDVNQQIDQAIERFLTGSLQQEANQQGWQDLRVSQKSTLLNRTSELAVCSQPLEVRTEGSLKPGRQRLEVHCSSPPGWTVLVNTELDIYVSAVTASQVIGRGETISAQQLDRVELDISKAPGGFFSETEQVVGMGATRRIRARQVISPALLSAPLLVRRGEEVTITANMEGVSASMPGEAMENGAKGDVIRVKNLRSQKIIDAKIVKEGVVSSTF